MVDDAEMEIGLSVPIDGITADLRDARPTEADDEHEARRGGQWRGRVWIADDFDELPADVATAFGMPPG